VISKTHESRRRRQLALLLGVLSACSARAISVLCSLLQVPPLLALLGPEGFGLWATLHAGIGLAGMLDGGVGYRRPFKRLRVGQAPCETTYAPLFL